MTPGEDYNFDVQDRVVKLTTSPGSTPEIEINAYVDESPLAVKEDATSISNYGRRERGYVIESLRSKSDAENAADKILNALKDPITIGKVVIAGIDAGIKPGGYVTVYDSDRGYSGTKFVVRKTVHRYPEGVTEVILGEFLPELYDFNRLMAEEVEVARRVSVLKMEPILYKQLYPIIDGTTYKFEESLIGTSEVYREYATSSGYDRYLACDVTVIGSGTNTYSDRLRVKIPSWTDGSKREFWGRADLNFTSEISADASDQITIRMTMFFYSDWGGTRHAIAPVVNDSSKYFETTITGVEKLMKCSISMRYVVARGEDWIRVYFGGENETCLYNWAFKPK
ncbi:hypothetical protein DRN93_05635 [archaeon]|nr:MAG: hypothetical protein DRN93_05635 [archaeon]